MLSLVGPSKHPGIPPKMMNQQSLFALETFGLGCSPGVKVQDQAETEILNCGDSDVQKTSRERDFLAETTSLIPGADVLMKFFYFTMLLPKMNKAKLQNCFIKGLLLSADNF